MDLVQDIITGVRENAGAIAVCIGVPIALAFLLGGDGHDMGGGSDCDGGDGGD